MQSEMMSHTNRWTIWLVLGVTLVAVLSMWHLHLAFESSASTKNTTDGPAARALCLACLLSYQSAPPPQPAVSVPIPPAPSEPVARDSAVLPRFRSPLSRACRAPPANLT